MLAVEARIGEPLDAYALAELDRAVDGVLADCDNLSNTFMASDEWGYGLDGPVTHSGMEVSVADTRTVHLEKTFARGEVIRGLDGVVLYLDLRTRSGDDGDLLGFGNLYGGGDLGTH